MIRLNEKIIYISRDMYGKNLYKEVKIIAVDEYSDAIITPLKNYKSIKIGEFITVGISELKNEFDLLLEDPYLPAILENNHDDVSDDNKEEDHD